MSESERIASFLSELVTERRLDRMEEVLSQRTRYITVALEDIYQSQNASAVLRTCECFGVQDVHIIENFNCFNVNPMVLKGSDKWLNIRRHNGSGNNSFEAVQSLKSEGYRIVATSLHEGSIELNSFNVERGKFAVVFGNEHQGVSKDMMALADEFLKIPMLGFTQSLNISVSAGIIVSRLMERIRGGSIRWQLTNQEKSVLRSQWLQSSVKNSQMLVKHLMEGDG